MAANFWTSNHRVTLVTEEEVRMVTVPSKALSHHRTLKEHGVQFSKVPRSLLIKGMDCSTLQQMKDYFCIRIFGMVHALKTARLRVATTACFYFHRFFLKYSMDQHDPRMMVPACIYLSGTSSYSRIVPCVVSEEQ